MIAALLATAAPPLAAALTPAERDGVTVAVAARDIAPGAELTAADLATTHVAAALVPSGTAKDPEELIGRRTSASVPAGTVVQEGMLASGSTPVPEDMALMAITAPAVLSAHLEPGVRLHVHGSGAVDDVWSGGGAAARTSSGSGGQEPEGTHLTAGDPAEQGGSTGSALTVLVVEVPQDAADGIDLGTTSGQDLQILVAVDMADERALARIIAEGWFTVSVIR